MGWAREELVWSPNSLPVSQRVHKVSRILRWVFNRAWVVEPVAQGKLIEVPEGTGAAFGGLEISAITDGFEGADALPVELLIAEGLVITGARAGCRGGNSGRGGREFAVKRFGSWI